MSHAEPTGTCERTLEPVWLPCKDQPIGGTLSQRLLYATNNSDRDWFLRLATAIMGHAALQGYALMLFYLFVLALEVARAGNEKIGAGQSQWKAPGLYSPAGLLAVLVLDDSKEEESHDLKMVISQLESNWMLSPRNTLNVTRGYWCGLNSQNIHTVFHPGQEGTIESRSSSNYVPLANYTSLFHNFIECRKQINKYYLQPWAQGIFLSRDPDLEDLPGAKPPDMSGTQAGIDVEPGNKINNDILKNGSRVLEPSSSVHIESATLRSNPLGAKRDPIDSLATKRLRHITSADSRESTAEFQTGLVIKMRELGARNNHLTTMLNGPTPENAGTELQDPPLRGLRGRLHDLRTSAQNDRKFVNAQLDLIQSQNAETELQNSNLFRPLETDDQTVKQGFKQSLEKVNNDMQEKPNAHDLGLEQQQDRLLLLSRP
ncbi:hypothetical protein F5B22DRAFT_650849 [Xylaria bambusicola]|uniref:uncharacterized protein n=1 Tax=Xylaria bambusicola TaxID=326684 RepID=UPI0020076004|nr:uncharacterized protein F5B22DRAFT_650849 [Xylaria bambusicola]KAI0506290.1 hypothetical protein F5B22DRAFT_650849 [Xylaria bambusicola]